MSDTNSDKTTSASSIPKKPPKRPKRDYSAMPQKPITLKHIEKKPVRTKQKAASQEQQPASKPTPRKKATNPWHLEGMSEEAKATIKAGAESEGLTIAHYLEQMVMQRDREAAPAQVQTPDAGTLSRISAIEQRLDLIEEQRGFWGSFWDRVMNTKE
ncbi:MAG: hypothetical protein ABW170_21455 [Candidatus Thiodiazotropha sp. L084R]